MSTRIEDEARFTQDDCAAVVIASFACRICLAAPDLIHSPALPVSAGNIPLPALRALNQVTMSDARPSSSGR